MIHKTIVDKTYTPISKIFARHGLKHKSRIPWSGICIHVNMIKALHDVREEGDPIEFYDFIVQCMEEKAENGIQYVRNRAKTNPECFQNEPYTLSELVSIKKKAAEIMIVEIMEKVFPSHTTT